MDSTSNITDQSRLRYSMFSRPSSPVLQYFMVFWENHSSVRIRGFAFEFTSIIVLCGLVHYVSQLAKIPTTFLAVLLSETLARLSPLARRVPAPAPIPSNRPRIPVPKIVLVDPGARVS